MSIEDDYGGSLPKPMPAGDGAPDGKARRRTIEEIVGDFVAPAEGPSATKEASAQLQAEIDELAKKEREIIARLGADIADACKAQLVGRAAVELTRTSDELSAKVQQLRSLTGNGGHLPKGYDAKSWKDRDFIPQLRHKIALRVTDHLARRTRAGRSAPAAGHGDEQRGERAADNLSTNLYSPTPIEHHDVLVIAPEGVHSPDQFYRFPVIRDARPGAAPPAEPPAPAAKGSAWNGQAAALPAAAAAEAIVDAPNGQVATGQYRDDPELLDAFDYGQRRALSFARPQDWGPASVRATQRGPAFSTLPLKPEPNAAAGGPSESTQCYLINTQNLNFRNAWTAEEWNDIPGGIDLPPAQGASHNEVEALLAGPQGRVFRLQLTSVAAWQPGTRARIVATLRTGDSEAEHDLGAIESVNLRPHMEVWHQLRGGTAMGRVYFNDKNGPRVIPLVNITTLTRD